MSGKYFLPRRGDRLKWFEIRDIPRCASEETIVAAIRQQVINSPGPHGWQPFLGTICLMQYKTIGDFGVDIVNKSGQNRTALVRINAFGEGDEALRSRCTIMIHNR